MDVSGSLDYLRFTVPEKKHINPSELMPPELYKTAILKNYGMYGYNRSLIAENGYLVLWHGSHANQGTCVQLSGDVINSMREMGYTHQSMIQLAVEHGKVTRVDYCMDIANHPTANPIDLYKAFKRGEFTTKAHDTYSYTESATKKEPARSFYQGRRKSPRFLRTYDKAKEMGLLEEALIRVELEVKYGRADTMARKMHSQGVVATGQAELNDYITLSSITWLNEALTSLEVGETAITPRKERDIDRYFRTQVIPCLRNRGTTVSSEVLHEIINTAQYALSAKTHSDKSEVR